MLNYDYYNFKLINRYYNHLSSFIVELNPVVLLILVRSPESIVALPSAESDRALQFFLMLLEMRLTNYSSVKQSVLVGPAS
jgi:hypothetical protein